MRHSIIKVYRLLTSEPVEFYDTKQINFNVMSSIFLYVVLVIVRTWKFTTVQVFHHVQTDFASVSTISTLGNNVVAKGSRKFSFFPDYGGV